MALLLGRRSSKEAVKLVYKPMMQGTVNTAVLIPGISIGFGIFRSNLKLRTLGAILIYS